MLNKEQFLEIIREHYPAENKELTAEYNTCVDTLDKLYNQFSQPQVGDVELAVELLYKESFDNEHRQPILTKEAIKKVVTSSEFQKCFQSSAKEFDERDMAQAFSQGQQKAVDMNNVLGFTAWLTQYRTNRKKV